MQDDETKREEQQERVEGKSPYQTPQLKRLGKVEQLTQGLHVSRARDDGAFSI